MIETIKFNQKKKVEELIEDYDETKTYQIQNQSGFAFNLIQDDKRALQLKDGMCFIYEYGDKDYYLEPMQNNQLCHINYWELEE